MVTERRFIFATYVGRILTRGECCRRRGYTQLWSVDKTYAILFAPFLFHRRVNRVLWILMIMFVVRHQLHDVETRSCTNHALIGRDAATREMSFQLWNVLLIHRVSDCQLRGHTLTQREFLFVVCATLRASVPPLGSEISGTEHTRRVFNVLMDRSPMDPQV